VKKNSEKIDLTEKDFEFICPVKSMDMKSIAGGYFCDQCEKKVYDVSDYTQCELDSLKANNSGVCINFKKIVTASLIVNATLCVAMETTGGNRLAPPTKFISNQRVLLEHREVIELGGGPAPITIFEPDDGIWVPIEPVEEPPSKDENSTKGEKCKGLI